MKLYVFGPMTGLPDFNYPAFDAAVKRLRSRGFEVVSPTETDARHDWHAGDHDPMAVPVDDYRRPLRWALRAALADDIDAGVGLPGWERSGGARLEALTFATLRLPVFEYGETDMLGIVSPQQIAMACGAFQVQLPTGWPRLQPLALGDRA